MNRTFNNFLILLVGLYISTSLLFIWDGNASRDPPSHNIVLLSDKSSSEEEPHSKTRVGPEGEAVSVSTEDAARNFTTRASSSRDSNGGSGTVETEKKKRGRSHKSDGKKMSAEVTAASAPVSLRSEEKFTNHLEFTLHGIDLKVINGVHHPSHDESVTATGMSFSPHADHQSELLRGFYRSYPLQDPPTTHFANVSIYYTIKGDDSTIHSHHFPETFTSGNFQNTIPREDFWPPYFKAQAAKVPPHLKSLGDCYDGVTKGHFRGDLTVDKKDPSFPLSPLLKDLEARGVNVESGWKNLASLYAHSEQAFLSCAVRGKLERVDEIDPSSIIIMIHGYHEPCGQCRKALKAFLEKKELRHMLIKSIFPKANDATLDTVKLDIVYIAADQEVVEQGIDIKGAISYFIEARR